MLRSFYYFRDDGKGFRRSCEVFTRGRLMYYRRDKGKGASPQKEFGRRQAVQLEKLIEKQHLRAWDGFQEDGGSGWSFSLRIEYDGGDEVSAEGRGFFPKGAKAAFPAIEAFFDEL